MRAKCIRLIGMLWMVVFAGFLPLTGCTQERPPLPVGTTVDAVPKVVVTKEEIQIGQVTLVIRKSPPEIWVHALGERRKSNVLSTWDALGMQISTDERDLKVNSPTVYQLYIYVRHSEFWQRTAIDSGGSFQHDRPIKTFSGYLEIDGVPIGPNMTLAEIQQWRKFLGLSLLARNGDYYRTGEDGKWAQHYFFEDDDKLTYVKFM